MSTLKKKLVPFVALIGLTAVSTTISTLLPTPASAQIGVNQDTYFRCRAASQLISQADLGYQLSDSYRYSERGYVVAPPPRNTYSARIWEENQCWGIDDVYAWFLAPPVDTYEVCLVAAQLGISQSQTGVGGRYEIVEAPSEPGRVQYTVWDELNCETETEQYYR